VLNELNRVVIAFVSAHKASTPTGPERQVTLVMIGVSY
jgi:hypothetical protein